MGLQTSATTYQSTQTFNGGVKMPTVTKTTAYTATSQDWTIRVNAVGGALTITLPTAASSTGLVFNIKKIDASANTVTIAGNGAETIDGVNTQATTTQWFNFQIQSNGTSWDVL